MKKKILIIVSIVLVIAISVFVFIFIKNKDNTTEPTATPIQTGPISDFKIYKNEQYSFEFRYPRDWKVTENVFSSPSSLFNLKLSPINEDLPSIEISPIDPTINIVTAKFGDNAFIGSGKGSDVIIGGVSGKRYEYKYEIFSGIGILLPFGQDRMILGTEKKYEDVFNQILSTFKFLK